jgi:hypothetical protein
MRLASTEPAGPTVPSIPPPFFRPLTPFSAVYSRPNFNGINDLEMPCFPPFLNGENGGGAWRVICSQPLHP